MRIIKDLYLNPLFFHVLSGIVLLFIFAFIFPWAYYPVLLILYLFIFLSLADILAVFRKREGIHGTRSTPERLSNGDENQLRIFVENSYPFKASVIVFDELPFQFQIRDFAHKFKLYPGKSQVIEYFLRPVKRGIYDFGALNIFVSTPLGFVRRRYRFSEGKKVPVYPSFLQMRKYELMAISNQLTEYGIKKIRRVGHNMEFEQIKEYIQGDDIRTLNWKATARRGQLMVNSYQDERSQQVYSLIDKGRMMQMPFKGMTLLDYAINASLVISNIAIKKDDKAGILTFQHKIGQVVPASKVNKQMLTIQETLYNQKTSFRESDFSRLHAFVKSRIKQRSLLLLFTNFESKVSLERQLPFIASLARAHVVVTIFFENTELDSLLSSPATSIRQIYHKSAGEKFAYEKKLIVKELNNYGIYTILTRPEDLTVNTINKYLELKARGVI